MTDQFYEKNKKPILKQGILEIVSSSISLAFCLICLFVPFIIPTVEGEPNLPVSSFDYVKALFSGSSLVGGTSFLTQMECYIGLGMIFLCLYTLFTIIIKISAFFNLPLYVKYVFYAHSSREIRYFARFNRLANDAIFFPFFIGFKCFGVLFSTNYSFNITSISLLIVLTVANLVLTSYLKKSIKNLPTISDSYLNQNDHGRSSV